MDHVVRDAVMLGRRAIDRRSARTRSKRRRPGYETGGALGAPMRSRGERSRAAPRLSQIAAAVAWFDELRCRSEHAARPLDSQRIGRSERPCDKGAPPARATLLVGPEGDGRRKNGGPHWRLAADSVTLGRHDAARRRRWRRRDVVGRVRYEPSRTNRSGNDSARTNAHHPVFRRFRQREPRPKASSTSRSRRP